MKKLLMLGLFLGLLMGVAKKSYAWVYVNGYTRSNGTYVMPYYRSEPGTAYLYGQ